MTVQWVRSVAKLSLLEVAYPKPAARAIYCASRPENCNAGGRPAQLAESLPTGGRAAGETRWRSAATATRSAEPGEVARDQVFAVRTRARVIDPQTVDGATVRPCARSQDDDLGGTRLMTREATRRSCSRKSLPSR